MIGVWLASVAALASPQGVRVEVSDDVVVDWTRLVVTVDTVRRQRETEGTEAVEELARRAVDAGIRLGAERIRVNHALTVEEVLEGPLADPILGRMGGWRVTETQYFSSGKVSVHAELPLQDLLKPWTVAQSIEAPVGPAESEWTGLMVDARGFDVAPAWAPRLLDVVGTVLYGGALWEDAAVNRSPIVYVDDPAHPAATAAGDRPLFLRARSAEGCDLTLAPEDVARFSSEAKDTRLPGNGGLVIVIDP